MGPYWVEPLLVGTAVAIPVVVVALPLVRRFLDAADQNIGRHLAAADAFKVAARHGGWTVEARGFGLIGAIAPGRGTVGGYSAFTPAGRCLGLYPDQRDAYEALLAEAGRRTVRTRRIP